MQLKGETSQPFLTEQPLGNVYIKVRLCAVARRNFTAGKDKVCNQRFLPDQTFLGGGRGGGKDINQNQTTVRKKRGKWHICFSVNSH